jgi:hypothetical protein
MSATTSIIAVLLAQRKRVIRDLRKAGALTASTAVPATTVRGFGRSQFDHLVKLGIVRVVADDNAFLDERRLAEWKEQQQGRARILLAVTIGVAVALVALAYYLQID